MLQPAYISRTHTIRHSLHRHANPYSFNDFSITSYHTKALSRLDVISDLPKSSNSSAILPILPSKKHPSHALSLVKVILNFHDLNVSFMIITHLPYNVSIKFKFLRNFFNCISNPRRISYTTTSKMRFPSRMISCIPVFLFLLKLKLNRYPVSTP